MKKPSKVRRVTVYVLGVLSMLTATVVTLLDYYYNDIIIWIWLLYGIVLVPLVLSSMVFFFDSLRLKTRFQKVMFVWGVLNLLLTVIVIDANHRIARAADPDEMVAYYHRNSDELRSLADYAYHAVNPGQWMYLEFERGEVSIFSVPGLHESYENINVEACCREVGLSREEFDEIRRRLEMLDCISVELSRSPEIKPSVLSDLVAQRDTGYVDIGRVRWMMSKYDFRIYLAPMSDSVWNHLLSPSCCELIPVCDSMALLYGSPAFGSTCFPNRDQYIKKWNLVER